MNDTKPRATSRTWNLTIYNRPCGENWGTTTCTVTITRTLAGLVAEVDNKVGDLIDVLRLVQSASDRPVVTETLETDPEAAAVSRRAYARCKLHHLIEANLPAAPVTEMHWTKQLRELAQTPAGRAQLSAFTYWVAEHVSSDETLRSTHFLSTLAEEEFDAEDALHAATEAYRTLSKVVEGSMPPLMIQVASEFYRSEAARKAQVAGLCARVLQAAAV